MRFLWHNKYFWGGLCDFPERLNVLLKGEREESRNKKTKGGRNQWGFLREKVRSYVFSIVANLFYGYNLHR